MISVPFSILQERTFAERLKKVRVERGYTQKQLSREAGLSVELVYKWENEYHGPSRRMLQRVATVLGVSPDFLLGSPRKQKVEVRAIRSPAEARPTNRRLVPRSNEPSAPHRETCPPTSRHASAQRRQRETAIRKTA